MKRKAVSERRLQTYFSEFARQVTDMCDKMEPLAALHTLNYTQVQLQSLFFQLPEFPRAPAPCISRLIVSTLGFLRMEKELLYYRLEHAQFFISRSVPHSPFHWSKQYHAIDLSEILCVFDLMTPNPLVLANGRAAPFNSVVQYFEESFNVKLGDPYELKRSVLSRKKDRAKFIKSMLYVLTNYEEE